MKTKMTLSQQLDKTYALAVHMGYIEAAEFLKGFLTKCDVIKNNNKVKRQVKPK
jgi:hypothetical protein